MGLCGIYTWDLYVGLFKRGGAFCGFEMLCTRLPTGFCKSLDLLLKGT